MVNKMYLVKFSQKAKKDKKALKRARLEKKAKELLNIIAEGNCSVRINIQHRIVYEVYEANERICDPGGPCEGVVLVKRMWSHYEGIR